MIVLQILGTLSMVFVFMISIRMFLEHKWIGGTLYDGPIRESVSVFLFLICFLVSFAFCGFIVLLIWGAPILPK